MYNDNKRYNTSLNVSFQDVIFDCLFYLFTLASDNYLQKLRRNNEKLKRNCIFNRKVIISLNFYKIIIYSNMVNAYIFSSCFYRSSKLQEIYNLINNTQWKMFINFCYVITYLYNANKYYDSEVLTGSQKNIYFSGNIETHACIEVFSLYRIPSIPSFLSNIPPHRTPLSACRMSVLPAFDQRMEILYGLIHSSLDQARFYERIVIERWGFQKSLLPEIYLHRLVSFADTQIWFYRSSSNTYPMFVFQCIFTKLHKIALKLSVTKKFITKTSIETFTLIYLYTLKLHKCNFFNKWWKNNYFLKTKFDEILCINYFLYEIDSIKKIRRFWQRKKYLSETWYFNGF